MVRKSNEILLHLIQDKHREKGGPLGAVSFLFPELSPEDRDQPDQGVAQAVGTVGNAIEGKGQGKDKWRLLCNTDFLQDGADQRHGGVRLCYTTALLAEHRDWKSRINASCWGDIRPAELAAMP